MAGCAEVGAARSAITSTARNGTGAVHDGEVAAATVPQQCTGNNNKQVGTNLDGNNTGRQKGSAFMNHGRARMDALG